MKLLEAHRFQRRVGDSVEEREQAGFALVVRTDGIEVVALDAAEALHRLELVADLGFGLAGHRLVLAEDAAEGVPRAAAPRAVVGAARVLRGKEFADRKALHLRRRRLRRP